MKKNVLNALLIFCMAILVVSCDKKEMEMDGMDVTMSYTPNPALKNTVISFTFDVKKDSMYQAVTMTSCEVIKNGTTLEMPVTEKIPGQYTGTYTFTEAGTYELHFKYMHDNIDTDQDFTILVK